MTKIEYHEYWQEYEIDDDHWDSCEQYYRYYYGKDVYYEFYDDEIDFLVLRALNRNSKGLMFI